MALVALGLTLTLGQIVLHKPNRWLMLRCALPGAATLFLCAFVNFASLIAGVNRGQGKIDTAYLCALSPTAAVQTLRLCPGQTPQIDGWRDWGFRNWRVLHTLRGMEAAHEDPRRG